MWSNAGMTNRQGDVDLRFALVSAPQLTPWLGLDRKSLVERSKLSETLQERLAALIQREGNNVA
jgi:hypothetical protein